jgi:hypothetical protein
MTEDAQSRYRRRYSRVSIGFDTPGKRLPGNADDTPSPVPPVILPSISPGRVPQTIKVGEAGMQVSTSASVRSL